MTQQTPLTTEQLTDIEAAIVAYQRHAPTGFACCTAHPVADAGAALLAEVRRLQARVAELEPDSALLAALYAAGVDNWEGYDNAREEADARAELAAAAAGESGSTR